MGKFGSITQGTSHKMALMDAYPPGPHSGDSASNPLIILEPRGSHIRPTDHLARYLLQRRHEATNPWHIERGTKADSLRIEQTKEKHRKAAVPLRSAIPSRASLPSRKGIADDRMPDIAAITSLDQAVRSPPSAVENDLT